MSGHHPPKPAPPAQPPKTPGPAGAQPAPTPPLPDNPYHRIYTKNNRFEDLVRQKKGNQNP